jgi:transketolase
MRTSAVERLTELAVGDPRIFLITGDLGFGVLTDFAERFPDQYLNAGVAEQNLTSVAAGIALEGRTVFTYSIANFPTLRCLEQLRNDVCYHNANVNVIAVGGGFSYGPLGMSHHATEDIAILRALPNMSVMVPSEPWQAAHAIDVAAEQPGPSYLRLDKSSGGTGQDDGGAWEFGKARMVRDGGTLTLVASGGILQEVVDAADELADKGINCRVLDFHTIKPLDADALGRAAQETGGIVTVEEHNLIGGLGAAVAESCLEGCHRPVLFHRIGLNDVYSDVVGSQQYLRDHYGMNAAAIVKTVEMLLRAA